MGYLHINVFAVLVAAALSFGLGALWYSPFLFAKQWMAAHGYTPEQVKAMQAGSSKAYALSFACYLVMAAALAVLINLTHVHGILGGIKLGLICWLGFAATVSLTAHLFSGKRWPAFLIDAGYQLAALALIGLILGAWR
ncbi:MAG TPA: DUF1761 domain-containing protein [Gammaproteobacteria bacterium]|nr:DUF1761 domain-containing protein [Gammaproteobacteria bacterium]